MAGSLQIQTVFFFLTTESIYYLLVTSIHMFSSIIIITSLPDIIVKTKHQNQFTADIPSLASILMYNNFASSVSLVCDPSYNITSPMNLSNNFLSLNDHEIPFLQTLLRNFYYPPGLTLSQHVCLFFMCSLNTVFLPISPPTEAWSLYLISSILQTLLWTYSFTSLQATTPKVMDKLNI